jgi:RNA polymerase sigma-70 factor (ECF subfamily)
MMAAVETAVAEVNVASGEDDFIEYFQRYKLKAYHYALQSVGNSEDAMDVTQEAFLRLHRHWSRRDTSKPFAPWLYAVVRNLAIDLIRKRSTRKESDLETAVPAPSPLPTPEAITSRQEVSDLLWREIGRLPGVQREALLLRDWHGLSYSEIAEATGTNTTTINSRIHDARARLRERLRRYL